MLPLQGESAEKQSWDWRGASLLFLQVFSLEEAVEGHVDDAKL